MTKQHIYNNFFNEFSGESPDDVIQAVYRESEAHTHASYAEWWAYQQGIWRQSYGAEIPDAHMPGACRALLDVLIEVGALEEGPKPVKKTAHHFEPG